jgi:DNA-binding CsgD family transcriptional regulator
MTRIGWRGIWGWRRAGRMRRWRPGWSKPPDGPLGRASEAAAILLEAARALAPADPSGAREALLEAGEAAVYAGWSASRAVLSEIAAAARATPAPAGSEVSATDLLVDGFAARAAVGYPAAVPLFRRAIAMLRGGDLSPREGLRLPRLGCFAATELWDDQAQHALAIRWVQLARDLGALTALPGALNNQGSVEVAAGRFDAARACVAEASEISAATGNPGVAGTAGVAEAYELAWRGREADTRRVGPAEAALGRLAERAVAAGTPLALGLLARSRALLAGDADAEPLCHEAIGQLEQCRAVPQLARAHLVYGEWLRRQRRRRDAREQLRTAHEMFTSMGAGAFAERARIELLATGERARQRTAEAAEKLTPQEAQIARLVSDGESNRDIAAQLFLSPSTVDYHLRKVFRKTGVTSRTQLARTITADRP